MMPEPNGDIKITFGCSYLIFCKPLQIGGKGSVQNHNSRRRHLQPAQPEWLFAAQLPLLPVFWGSQNGLLIITLGQIQKARHLTYTKCGSNWDRLILPKHHLVKGCKLDSWAVFQACITSLHKMQDCPTPLAWQHNTMALSLKIWHILCI